MIGGLLEVQLEYDRSVCYGVHWYAIDAISLLNPLLPKAYPCQPPLTHLLTSHITGGTTQGRTQGL